MCSLCIISAVCCSQAPVSWGQTSWTERRTGNYASLWPAPRGCRLLLWVQHAHREVEAQEKRHFSTGVCRSLLIEEHRSECGSRLCSQRSKSFISTERSLKSTVGWPEHQRSQAKSWESPPACTFTQAVSVWLLLAVITMNSGFYCDDTLEKLSVLFHILHLMLVLSVTYPAGILMQSYMRAVSWGRRRSGVINTKDWNNTYVVQICIKL